MNINNDYSIQSGIKLGIFDGIRYTAKQNYLAHLKNGTCQHSIIQDLYNETQKLKDKNTKSHWLLTINCKDSNVKRFVQVVHSLKKIKWINKEFTYCFELSEKGNLHSHWLIHNNANKKSYSIDQIYSRVLTVVKDKNCIDIKSIWNSDVNNVLDYLEKKNDPKQANINKLFREANNISPLYHKGYYLNL